MVSEDSEETSHVDKSEPNDVISRRTYLKGAVGAAGVVFASRSAAAATDYDTITVGAGERRDISVNSGDTFANKLIDITADGATFRIEATGSNWEIRNVGVKGVWDVTSSGHEQGISASVESGSSAVIDNYYFADGCPDDTYPGVTGIYVQRSHAGALQINNVNIQDLPNNAIYASTAGYPEDNTRDLPGGGQGPVVITNSYAADCQASHYRVGTDGSRIENCVGVNGDRGVWAKFNPVEVSGCDFSGANTSRADGDLVCGENNEWGDTNPAINVSNSYFGTTAPGDQGINYPGTISGDSVSSVRRTSPSDVSGVPTTAEEAASGGSTSGGDSGGSSDDDSGGSTSSSEFRIETAEDASTMSYEFVVDGEIVQGIGTEDPDSWTSSDGQTTATGEVGNGYGDGYELDGQLVDWSATVDSSNYTLLVDGQEIDPAQFDDSGGSSDDDSGGSTSSSEFRIETAEDASTMSYEFVVDGEIVQGIGTEDPDSWTSSDGQTTATGEVGNGYGDGYELDGQLVDWSATVDSSNYTLLVDGQEIDPISTSTPKSLTIETRTDAPLVEYEFTVEGSVTKGANTEDSGSIAADTLSQSDGQTQVTGASGRGYTDDYEFQGSLIDWSADVDASYYTVIVDGKEIDPQSL